MAEVTDPAVVIDTVLDLHCECDWFEPTEDVAVRIVDALTDAGFLPTTTERPEFPRAIVGTVDDMHFGPSRALTVRWSADHRTYSLGPSPDLIAAVALVMPVFEATESV